MALELMEWVQRSIKQYDIQITSAVENKAWGGLLHLAYGLWLIKKITALSSYIKSETGYYKPFSLLFNDTMSHITTD